MARYNGIIIGELGKPFACIFRNLLLIRRALRLDIAKNTVQIIVLEISAIYKLITKNRSQYFDDLNTICCQYNLLSYKLIKVNKKHSRQFKSYTNFLRTNNNK